MSLQQVVGTLLMLLGLICFWFYLEPKENRDICGVIGGPLFLVGLFLVLVIPLIPQY